MNNQVIRRGKFDAAHRLLQNESKCRNLHGHEYFYEITVAWFEADAAGFAIDFSDLKKIACTWFDLAFDHAFIANPKDESFLELCRRESLRCYPMHLGGTDAFCNPTAENIAKEMFYACEVLLNSNNLRVLKIKLQETSNCLAVCSGLSPSERDVLDLSPLAESLRLFKMSQNGTSQAG